MNLIHKEAITRNLVESIKKMVDGTVRYQSVFSPKGRPLKRIVIEYEYDDD